MLFLYMKRSGQKKSESESIHGILDFLPYISQSMQIFLLSIILLTRINFYTQKTGNMDACKIF